MNDLLDCPFCGSSNVDPEAWASRKEKGPGCLDCGATAERAEAWNSRGDEKCPVIDPSTWVRTILGVLKSFPEWQRGEWAGDKEGWGFNFEFIKWLRKQRELKTFSLTCGNAQWIVRASEAPTAETVRRRCLLDPRDEVHVREINLLNWEPK